MRCPRSGCPVGDLSARPSGVSLLAGRYITLLSGISVSTFGLWNFFSIADNASEAVTLEVLCVFRRCPDRFYYFV